MFSVSFQIYRLAENKNSKSLCPHTWRLPRKIKPRTGDFCGSIRSRGKDIRFTVARADMQNQGRIQHHKPWCIAANFQEGKSITRQKSSQVSPNTRWLAQCKGGGGKKKICTYLEVRVMNWRICEDRYARGVLHRVRPILLGTVGTLFRVWLVHFSGYARYAFRIWQGTLVPPQLYQLYPSCDNVYPKKGNQF